MAGPVVRYVLNKIEEEFLFLWDLDKELRRLRDELQRTECFLEDADTRRNNDETVKVWVKDLIRAAYRAEDLVESFALEEENNRRGRKVCIGGSFFHSRFPGQLLARHKFGREIQPLLERIHRTRERGQCYGIADLSAGDEGKRYVDEKIARRRRAVLHAPDSYVVGMEEEKKAILDLLLGNKEARRSVVSIWGMGGLGKTTLAKKVFHDSTIERNFDLAVWIDVPQQYRGDDLLRELYMKVTKKNGEVGTMTAKKVEEILYRSLHQKKYLIVIDDVWDKEVWEIFEKRLPDEGNGSRVLITTRVRNVVPFANHHNLHFLSEEDSWELCLRKAFTNEDRRKVCQGDFEKKGKEIVKQCGGLPLALVVVGRLLWQKKILVKWDEIWRDGREGQDCMRILALSYADLPQHLKWCFLYLGAFPEDFKIDVDKLIRLWIAEGFIKGRRHKTLEEVAKEYLDELVCRSLAQFAQRSPEDNQQCHIHNLLRELAIEESDELDFFHRQQKVSLDYRTLRRFSFHTTSEEFLSRGYSTPSLRTLLGFKLYKMPICFPTCDMQLIRVIDLEGAPIEVVPKQVKELANLRYLGLRRTLIKSLPSSVQELSRLQTLDVRDTYMKKMNSGVWKIEALRHILFPLDMDMNGIQEGSLRNLQVLEYAKVGAWMSDCLSRLRNLQTLRLGDICEVHHENLSEALPMFSYLTALELSGKSIPAIGLMLSNLENLHRVFFNGRIQFSQPLQYQWPSRLSILNLLHTELDQDPLPSLGRLRKLRVLNLGFNSYHGTEMICHRDSFPQLQTLSFGSLTRLEEWKLDDGAMPCLRSLKIVCCEKLMKLPQGLKSLADLEELFLSHMSTSFYARIQKDDGEDWESIQHVPSINISDV